VVTVQKEVGQRLASAPRRKSYGALSVLAQIFYEVELRKMIRPTCFYPPPQVDSALVRLRLRDRPLVDLQDETLFAAFTKHLFSQRRKQLGTILRNAPEPFRIDPADFPFTLQPFDVSPRQRPEALSPDRIALLSNTLAHAAGERRRER
jgi:16S rRNA (adenine1518-N6/adenine1519-N6)-dimethyltransferase